MAKQSKATAWDPRPFLALQDIALWDSTFRRETEYQSLLHDGKTIQQSLHGVEAQQLTATDEDGVSHELLRALVHMGVRSVLASDADSDPEEVTVLHEITATFAVYYKVLAVPPADEFEQFCRFNCVHNAWPFWRQHVFETLKKASLPLIEIPLFSGKGPREGRTNDPARN